MTARGTFEIEVGVRTAPDGREMVLLQLPDGHALISPADALWVAVYLLDAVTDITAEAS